MSSDRLTSWASVAAAALLAPIAAIHVFWAIGGDWALDTVSGGEVETPSLAGRVFLAVVAILAVAAAVELLALAGELGGRIHVPMLRRTVWVVAGVLCLGGIALSGQAPAVGLSALALASLFSLVAAGERSTSRTRRR